MPYRLGTAGVLPYNVLQEHTRNRDDTHRHAHRFGLERSKSVVLALVCCIQWASTICPTRCLPKSKGSFP